MISIRPILFVSALFPFVSAQAEEALIISNRAQDPVSISNAIVASSGGISASDISASMQDFLFVKTTPDGRECFGNAASLRSVACSTTSVSDFRYELTWTMHTAPESGCNALSLSSFSVDWALLRQHINTNGITTTYNGESVLLPYDLYFRYSLSRTGENAAELAQASVCVPIAAVQARSGELCSASGSIYLEDNITFPTDAAHAMSAARAEVATQSAILLEDGATYNLTLTLDKVTKAGTQNEVELNREHLTYFGTSVAHVWTYAAVGNVGFSGELINTPEPSTATLSLLALSALSARRRRH